MLPFIYGCICCIFLLAVVGASEEKTIERKEIETVQISQQPLTRCTQRLLRLLSSKVQL